MNHSILKISESLFVNAIERNINRTDATNKHGNTLLINCGLSARAKQVIKINNKQGLRVRDIKNEDLKSWVSMGKKTFEELTSY